MGELKLVPELEYAILLRLAEGEALNAICSDPKIPVAESTVRKRATEDEDFGARYARARSVGYDCRAERAVERTKTPEARKNPAAARVEFDAERWYLGKMKPLVYGDKLDLTSAGESLKPMDDTEKLTRIASILALGQQRLDAPD